MLLPTKAISTISAKGQPFYDPEADTATLFDAIKSNLAKGIELKEINAEINTPEFSQACAEALLINLGSKVRL